MEPRARAGNRAADARLLGVRPDGHRFRPARRAGSRRARPHLPPQRADPELADRGRALRPRGDRGRVQVARNHDARAPLQPDEAQPRRRTRPRPHHPRRSTRPRPRVPRVPPGPRGADPDDGPHVHRAAEHGDRREGGQVRLARRRRGRHRGAAAGRRPVRLHADPRPGRARARPGLGVTIHVGEEGGPFGIEEIAEVVEALRPDRIGHGILAARDPT